MMGAETTYHFILNCTIHANHRRDLFQIVNPIFIEKKMYPLNESKPVHILYGHEALHFRANQTLLKATINFIENQSRFSQS